MALVCELWMPLQVASFMYTHGFKMWPIRDKTGCIAKVFKLAEQRFCYNTGCDFRMRAIFPYRCQNHIHNQNCILNPYINLKLLTEV